MARWPTVRSLAATTQEEMNEMWAGLGYYRRARILLEGGELGKKSYYPITLWTIEKSLHENAPLTYLKFVQSTFRNVVSDEFLFQKKGSQMNSHLTNCWLYAAVFLQHRHLASLLSVACL
ncbi:hypothetical protein SETIT_2G120500v2 [Setaria italica]|uniref:Uncharacterized protein n=1 Tax=Setaria italica TaxID=4555 RepID=A0A368PY26_SETIT|nr:uncharacterized protein LOC101779654 [Setaria italica]RCV10549.1 hypothetical protein SETIT_2G120500v2 [Setaria italica]